MAKGQWCWTNCHLMFGNFAPMWVALVEATRDVEMLFDMF